MPDSQLPVLDISPLVRGGEDATSTARDIGDACREWGFFRVVGHGVDPGLQSRLEELSRQFFAQPLTDKLRIRMELGGKAWRGYFPLGSELTSGQPDQKEGLYFGAELDERHPMVASGTPLHGPNLFPEIAGFRDTVLQYVEAMTGLGHTLMQGIALSLGLDRDYFHQRYTGEPIVLFRIFHYPPLPDAEDQLWSVGEHSDYGLLTILAQDEVPGLSVQVDSGWIDVPPVAGSYVCNLGDMLDRMTGGLYRSTPHRVRNCGQRGRLSFPFFFDPGWQARIEPIHPGAPVAGARQPRWDDADLHAFRGTYGEYLLDKVSAVFPGLGRDLL